MGKWIFKSKFVNEDTYKHNGEDVKLLGVNGVYATVEFMDGTQAEVFALEVQKKSEYPYIVTLTISAEDCEDIIVKDAGSSLDDVFLKSHQNRVISETLERYKYPTKKTYDITILTELREEYYDSDEYTVFVKEDYTVDIEM